MSRGQCHPEGPPLSLLAWGVVQPEQDWGGGRGAVGSSCPLELARKVYRIITRGPVCRVFAYDLHVICTSITCTFCSQAIFKLNINCCCPSGFYISILVSLFLLAPLLSMTMIAGWRGRGGSDEGGERTAPSMGATTPLQGEGWPPKLGLQGGEHGGRGRGWGGGLAGVGDQVSTTHRIGI